MDLYPLLFVFVIALVFVTALSLVVRRLALRNAARKFPLDEAALIAMTKEQPSRPEHRAR